MRTRYLSYVRLGLLLVAGCEQQGSSLLTNSVSVDIDGTIATCYSADTSVCLVVWHDLPRVAAFVDGDD